MSDYAKRLLERMSKLSDAGQMGRLGGIENDDVFRLNVELADSSLPSADKGLDRAYNMAMRAAVSKQLNPPAATSLIPPPPPDVALVFPGEECDTGRLVWFRADEDVCGGVVIVGCTGSGKTVLLSTIIRCLPPSSSFFAYLPDSKREIFRIYRTLNLPFLYVRPCNLPIALMACPTENPEVYFTGLLEKWAPLLPARDETWPPCAAALAAATRLMKPTGPMTLNQAAAIASGLVETSGKEKFGTFSAQLSVLAQLFGKKNANLQAGPVINGRYRGLGVDWSGVSLKSRHLSEIAITQQFLQGNLSKGFSTSGSCLVLIHDEGADTWSRILSPSTASSPNWQDDLLVKSRALRVGKIVILQFVSQGSDALWSSVHVIIVMRLPDYGEASRACRYLNLPPDEFAPVIMNLPTGEAFIKTPVLPHGVRIKTPFVDLGPYPSDAEIAARMAPEIKWLEEHSTYADPPQVTGTMDKDVAAIIERDIRPSKAPESPAVVTPEPVEPVTLLSDWARFLNAVLVNPSAASSMFAGILNFGSYKTSRLAKALVAAGLLATVTAKTKGHRSPVRYIVTRKGLASLEALTRHDGKR